MTQLIDFGFRQLAYYDRLATSQAIKRVRGQPARLVDPEVPPRRCNYPKTRNIGGLAHEVDNCFPLLVVKQIEIVDKENGSTVDGEIDQQVARSALEPEHAPQGDPSPGNRSAWAEHDDPRFNGRLLGKML
jgi:hypothetical protein